MDWKELQEKYKQLQADGKTAEEAAETLRDEICVFAKECTAHPEKMADVMSELGKAIQGNPVASTLLFSLLLRPRGGWGW